MKNNNDIDKLLRAHLTPDGDNASGSGEAAIDFNLLARYADGTATPEDKERIAELQSTNPEFAELVEAPGTIRSDQVRVIPFRRRWLPMALRYAACFVAVLIGSVFLYQHFGPEVPAQKPFIVQAPKKGEIKLNTRPKRAKSYVEKDHEVTKDSAAGTAGGSGYVAKESSIKRDTSLAVAKKAVVMEAESVVAGSSIMDERVDYDLADKERLAGAEEKRDKQVLTKKSKGLHTSSSTVEQAEPTYGTGLARTRQSAVTESGRAIVTTKAVVAPELSVGRTKARAASVASSISESKPVAADAIAKKSERAELRAEAASQADNTCALFIGIDTYTPEQAGVAPLKNAVIDMNNVQVAMNDFPFAEVQTLSNEKATRANIDTSIRELRRTAGTNGSLLIYYNGQAVQYAEQPEQQFLVPADGSVNQAGLFDNNISVATLNNDAAAAPIRNTYVVLDCEFQPAAGEPDGVDQYNRELAMDMSAGAITTTVKEAAVMLAGTSSEEPASSTRQERRKAVKEKSEIFLSNTSRLSYSYIPQKKEITGEDIANFVASNESVRIQQAPVQQMLRRYRQVEQKGRNFIFYRADHAESSASPSATE